MMTRRRYLTRTLATAGFVGLLTVAGVLASTSRDPLASQGSPRYVYSAGFQGVGYYAVPAAGVAPAAATTLRAAPAPRAQTPARTVGPGARNWASGNRVPLHRPWLRAQN